MKSVSVSFLVLLVSFSSYSQIIINEIGSSNTALLADEDGDYPDWIELYNSGASSVNLLNYTLSDNPLLPAKWVFPDYILAPGAHLIVYASNKDRKLNINHWETAVFENDTWKYLVPTSEPDFDWDNITFNDAAWPTAQGGFGIGDGDDHTLLTSPVTSVYLRKTFTVTDLSAISEGALHIDYDDGYIAFLNGVIVAGNNLRHDAQYTTLANAEHEAKMYAGGNPELTLIHKDVLNLSLTTGTNVLCIQVNNVSATSDDLSARPFLSFGITNTSSYFSPPPAWFTLTKDRPVHTNFKISSGETIVLSDATGTVIDQKVTPSMATDQSYGRLPDGSSTWSYFRTPTPGAANSATGSFSSYCTTPVVFSLPDGFYTSAQTISLSGPSTIRYTLDGSVPTASSTLYTAAIHADTNTIIRAACFTTGAEPLEIATATYLINKPTKLPVFSITTNPGLLFDPVTGIYMLGPDASSIDPFFGANFWLDKDIPIHIEFFETNKVKHFSQDANLRIYGNYSRANQQKSFSIGAKSGESFDYSFFPDKPIKNCSEFVLRNSGNDFNIMQYHDGFVQKAMMKTNIDIQNYRPAITYINGVYWGVLNIREKINAEYVEHISGISKSKIDLAEVWGDTLHGTCNIWEVQWLATNFDLTNEANYLTVADSFDLNNLIDYYSAEIFISNWDWPGNNLKYWRPQTGERKWRMILWDTDISLGLFNQQGYDFNALGNIKNAVTGTKGPVTDIFKSMLVNTEFRNKFINRYADLMNSTLKPSELDKTLYALKDSIDEEMPKHFVRWTDRNWSNWDDAIESTRSFYTSRLPYARNEIKTEFGLTKQVALTLQAVPAGSGVIKINSIYPDVYPWTGIYYDGVPVEITAMPNPGYTFDHWSANALIISPNTIGNPKMTINITSAATTFTANFTGTSVPVKLGISEINYNSPVLTNSGDWVELYNYGTAVVDISGWYLKDDKEYNRFTMPANTVIAAGERLVICNDLIKFQARFPAVSNVVGPMPFSLSNDGDNVRLYTDRGNLFTSVHYSPKAPWPAAANGLGYTLECSDLSAPNASSAWHTGCIEGSPGKAFDASCVTAVITASEDSGILVFPNPVSSGESLNIRISSSVDIMAYSFINMQGAELLSASHSTAQQEFSFSTSSLPAGMYTLLLYTATDTYIKKIIVQ